MSFFGDFFSVGADEDGFVDDPTEFGIPSPFDTNNLADAELEIQTFQPSETPRFFEPLRTEPPRFETLEVEQQARAVLDMRERLGGPDAPTVNATTTSARLIPLDDDTIAQSPDINTAQQIERDAQIDRLTERVADSLPDVTDAQRAQLRLMFETYTAPDAVVTSPALMDSIEAALDSVTPPIVNEALDWAPAINQDAGLHVTLADELRARPKPADVASMGISDDVPSASVRRALYEMHLNGADNLLASIVEVFGEDGSGTLERSSSGLTREQLVRSVEIYRYVGKLWRANLVDLAIDADETLKTPHEQSTGIAPEVAPGPRQALREWLLAAHTDPVEFRVRIENREGGADIRSKLERAAAKAEQASGVRIKWPFDDGSKMVISEGGAEGLLRGLGLIDDSDADLLQSIRRLNDVDTISQRRLTEFLLSNSVVVDTAYTSLVDARYMKHYMMQSESSLSLGLRATSGALFKVAGGATAGAVAAETAFQGARLLAPSGTGVLVNLIGHNTAVMTGALGGAAVSAFDVMWRLGVEQAGDEAVTAEDRLAFLTERHDRTAELFRKGEYVAVATEAVGEGVDAAGRRLTGVENLSKKARVFIGRFVVLGSAASIATILLVSAALHGTNGRDDTDPSPAKRQNAYAALAQRIGSGDVTDIRSLVAGQPTLQSTSADGDEDADDLTSLLVRRGDIEAIGLFDNGLIGAAVVAQVALDPTRTVDRLAYSFAQTAASTEDLTALKRDDTNPSLSVHVNAASRPSLFIARDANTVLSHVMRGSLVDPRDSMTPFPHPGESGLRVVRWVSNAAVAGRNFNGRDGWRLDTFMLSVEASVAIRGKRIAAHGSLPRVLDDGRLAIDARFDGDFDRSDLVVLKAAGGIRFDHTDSRVGYLVFPVSAALILDPTSTT